MEEELDTKFFKMGLSEIGFLFYPKGSKSK